MSREMQIRFVSLLLLLGTVLAQPACDPLTTQGSSETCNDYVDGELCTLDCSAASYFSYGSGDLSRTCVNGTWGGTELICNVNCDPPGDKDSIGKGPLFYEEESGLGRQNIFHPYGGSVNVTLVWGVPIWVQEDLTELHVNGQFEYTFATKAYWEKNTALDPCYDFYYINIAWDDLKSNLARTESDNEIVFEGITHVQYGQTLEVGGDDVQQILNTYAVFEFKFQKYVEVSTCESCMTVDVSLVPTTIISYYGEISIDFGSSPYVTLTLVLRMSVSTPYALGPWLGHSSVNVEGIEIHDFQELPLQSDCDGSKDKCVQFFGVEIHATQPLCNVNGVYKIAFDLKCIPNQSGCTPPQFQGELFTQYTCDDPTIGTHVTELSTVDADYTVDFFWTPHATLSQIAEVIRFYPSASSSTYMIPGVRTDANLNRLRIYTSNVDSCVTDELLLNQQYRITIVVSETLQTQVYVDGVLHAPCSRSTSFSTGFQNVRGFIGGPTGTAAQGKVCNLRYFKGQNYSSSEITPDVKMTYTLNNDNENWCPTTLENVMAFATTSSFQDVARQNPSNHFNILDIIYFQISVSIIGFTEVASLKVVEGTGSYTFAEDPIDVIGSADTNWNGGQDCTDDPGNVPTICWVSFEISAKSFPIGVLSGDETVSIVFKVEITFVHDTSKMVMLLQFDHTANSIVRDVATNFYISTPTASPTIPSDTETDSDSGTEGSERTVTGTQLSPLTPSSVSSSSRNESTEVESGNGTLPEVWQNDFVVEASKDSFWVVSLLIPAIVVFCGLFLE